MTVFMVLAALLTAHNESSSSSSCSSCSKTTRENRKCPVCSKYFCDECIDSYSGLCVDCTKNLLGSVDDNILDEYYRREQEREKEIEPEGFRCGYCGAEINSDQLIEAHDGYTICPKCSKMLEKDEVISEDEHLLDSDEYEGEEEDSSEEKDDYYE